MAANLTSDPVPIDEAFTVFFHSLHAADTTGQSMEQTTILISTS